jgi:hypothetical protein
MIPNLTLPEHAAKPKGCALMILRWSLGNSISVVVVDVTTYKRVIGGRQHKSTPTRLNDQSSKSSL